MHTSNNVHQQFAEFFPSEILKPFAFLVSKKLSEGHICIDPEEAVSELADSSYYDASEVKGNITKLKDEPQVTGINGKKQPFVLHNKRLYLQRYFQYETSIVKRIKEFVEREKDKNEPDNEKIAGISQVIQASFTSSPFTESKIADENVDWQLVATLCGVLNNFTIITGGPGTGKTTTVAKILAILYAIDANLRVALVAPTGKAAVRMAESLKATSLDIKNTTLDRFQEIVPGTIHRLLKYIPGSPYFQHSKDNPVNYDVVIVDETSVIDAALFAKLLDAIGPATKLILLGDKDQLASVEAGSLFGDLCKAESGSGIVSKERAEFVNSFIPDPRRQIPDDSIIQTASSILSGHIIELKRSHRFESGRGIGKFSKAIIKNDVEALGKYFLEKTDEQVLIDTKYDPEIFERFVDGYTDYVRERDIRKALKKLNRLRVLCAVREGEHGVYNLNNVIEIHLRKKKLINKTSEYYENRPIIVTRNYYSLGLFNGDTGIIRADENGVLKAWFEDSNNELKSVLPGYVAESETVFAMTIHKSQGSEYDQVLVVLPDSTHLPLLTRELLYTAVTRAKSRVIVQASESAMLYTANGVVERASGIMERFGE